MSGVDNGLTLSHRFTVEAKLGEGGMGAVYEAIDRERNARVALKRLRQLEPREVQRFKGEFRKLQGLHHPNLVSLGELVEEQGHWFFTMELVRGQDLLTYVRTVVPQGDLSTTTRPMSRQGSREAATLATPVLLESSEVTVNLDLPSAQPVAQAAEPQRVVQLAPRSFDEYRLRSTLGQLARGLYALHRAGKVHRDVKPSNILVTEQGRVVLLDFGILSDLEERDEEGLVTGTPAYMAPEQTHGAPASPEADWYSVGVLLYEALTGRKPFLGTPQQVMEVKRQVEPVPPQQLVEGLPPDLSQLCCELLHISPRQRPSGEEVLRRLGVEEQARAEAWWTGTLPFVGRSAELRALHQSLADSRQGATVVARLQGESGVGKTRLMRRFLDEVVEQWPEAVILSGQCYERESVPFKGVDGIIDALGRYLSGRGQSRAKRVLSGEVAALGHLFPVLWQIQELQAQRSAEVPRDPRLLRLAGFAALRQVLGRLASLHPLVLVVDDWQWAGQDSQALLDEVLQAPGLLLLGTVRVGATEKGARRWVEESQAWQSARVIALERLPSQEAQELVQRLLGESGVAAQEVERIVQEAGGHPLFIDALVRCQLQEGQARPLALEEALWTRARVLEESALQLLELLAIAGGPLPHAVATHATALGPSEYMKATASLRSARLALTTGPRDQDTVEAIHDKVRVAVLPHLAASQRQGWHMRLATALEALQQNQPERLGRHWHEAGQLERAAGYYLKAARHAVKALAFAHAAELYRKALDTWEWEEFQRRQLQLELGGALSNAGRGPEAAQALLAAAQGCPEDEAWRLRRRAAEQYLLSGHLREGLAGMREVLARHGVGYPRNDRVALASVLWQRAKLSLRTRTWFTFKQGRPLNEREQEHLEALGSVSRVLSSVDLLCGYSFSAQYLLLALHLGEPRHLGRALASELMAQAIFNPHALSHPRRLEQRLEQVIQQLGDDPQTLGFILAQRAMRALLLFDYAAARELCEQSAAQLQRCQGAYWERGLLANAELLTRLWLGEFEFARKSIALPLAEARERGDIYSTLSLQLSTCGQLHLAEDNPQGARHMADESLALWTGQGFQFQHFLHFFCQAHTDLYEGRGHQALDRIEKSMPLMRKAGLLRMENAWCSVTTLRCRALLLAASEGAADPEPLLREAEAEARRLERLPFPMPRAMAQLVRACLAAARGAKDAAEQYGRATITLEKAHMIFYAACMRWRHGELLGGAEGRLLISASEQWMRKQGIRRPGAMMNTAVPDARPPAARSRALSSGSQAQ